MKKMTLFALAALCMIPGLGFGADKPEKPVIVRPSIFSTSTDWEGVTGLRLGLYSVKFIPDYKLIQKGLELYYLDSFPCYGQPDRTQIWIDAKGKTERNMLITCLYAPQTIKLAWRHATAQSVQDTTVGMLECPVKGEYELTIDMSKCVKGKDWKEYK